MFRDALVFACGVVFTIAGNKLYNWITAPTPKDERQDLKDHHKYYAQTLLNQLPSNAKPAEKVDAFGEVVECTEDVVAEAMSEVRASFIG